MRQTPTTTGMSFCAISGPLVGTTGGTVLMGTGVVVLVSMKGALVVLGSGGAGVGPTKIEKKCLFFVIFF